MEPPAAAASSTTLPVSWVPLPTPERSTLPNEESPVRGKMGFNWFWYVPLVTWVCIDYGIDNSIRAYRNFRTIFQFPHYWIVLFSPCAYVFAFASLLNFWTPTMMAFLIPWYFTAETSNDLYKKRYQWTVLTILGIIASGMITAAVIWGSFPLIIYPDGSVATRFLPFIPWPHPPVQ